MFVKSFKTPHLIYFEKCKNFGTVTGKTCTNRAFHRFGQAKFAYGGLVLGSSQFSVLPQLPHKMMLASKVVKTDSKIIIALRLSMAYRRNKDTS